MAFKDFPTLVIPFDRRERRLFLRYALTKATSTEDEKRRIERDFGETYSLDIKDHEQDSSSACSGLR